MRLALGALALASASTLAGCGGDGEVTTRLGESGPSPLVVPELNGEKPFSWFQREDAAVVLSWSARGPLGADTAILSKAPAGNLCDAMPSTYDSCNTLDPNAASFAFEEQGSVVVRRGTTLVTWPDLVLEGPDESGFDLRAEE